MSNSSLPSSEQVRLLAYKLLRSCCLNSFGLDIKYVALNYCVSTWNSVVLNEVSFICLKEMPSKDQCLFPVFSPPLCDPPFPLLQNFTLPHYSPIYLHHTLPLYCVFYPFQPFSLVHTTLHSSVLPPILPYLMWPYPTLPHLVLPYLILHLTPFSILFLAIKPISTLLCPTQHSTLLSCYINWLNLF